MFKAPGLIQGPVSFFLGGGGQWKSSLSDQVQPGGGEQSLSFSGGLLRLCSRAVGHGQERRYLACDTELNTRP